MIIIIKSLDILRCINDKSADLFKKELERIIDEDIEKLEDMMDADLIEYCLHALNEQGSEECRDVEKEKVGDTNGKCITRRFRKLLQSRRQQPCCLWVQFMFLRWFLR